MRWFVSWFPSWICALLAVMGCIREFDAPARTDGGPDTLSDTSAMDSYPVDTTVKPLCERYGGKRFIAKVTQELAAAHAANCRVNAHFLTLAPEKLQHVVDCLTIQLQAATGCINDDYTPVTYPGKDAKGLACVGMKTSHTGLNLSDGDFEAILEDTLSTFIKAGIRTADAASIISAIDSTRPDIVESSSTNPSRSRCDAGADISPAERDGRGSD